MIIAQEQWITSFDHCLISCFTLITICASAGLYVATVGHCARAANHCFNYYLTTMVDCYLCGPPRGLSVWASARFPPLKLTEWVAKNFPEELVLPDYGDKFNYQDMNNILTRSLFFRLTGP